MGDDNWMWLVTMRTQTRGDGHRGREEDVMDTGTFEEFKESSGVHLPTHCQHF